jgi:glycosyltransferase involved in cell wall biosynthesis
MQWNNTRPHIGIAGPISLAPLEDLFKEINFPITYSFPLVGILARDLIEKGYKISVFATSTEISRPLVFTSTSNASIHIIPQRRKRAAYDFYYLERKALAKSMVEAKCDLIHAHWTYEFAAAALDAKQNCIITAHDAPQAILKYFATTRYFPYWAAKFLLSAHVIRKARRLTAVSPYCADSIKKFFFPKDDICVVPNGIDADTLSKGLYRLNNKQTDSKRPQIAMVLEGFQNRKNPKTALVAFAKIREAFPMAKMHIAGSGYGPAEDAEIWAQKNELHHGVCFMGKLSHDRLISFLFDKIDLLIHPALEESFGMAPLEAMALGIPVIGHKFAGGVPYVLDDGKAGVLVNTRISHEIAAAAINLFTNFDFRKKLSESAWKHASMEFSFKNMVSRYEACYKNALNGCSPYFG